MTVTLVCAALALVGFGVCVGVLAARLVSRRSRTGVVVISRPRL